MCHEPHFCVEDDQQQSVFQFQVSSKIILSTHRFLTFSDFLVDQKRLLSDSLNFFLSGSVNLCSGSGFHCFRSRWNCSYEDFHTRKVPRTFAHFNETSRRQPSTLDSVVRKYDSNRCGHLFTETAAIRSNDNYYGSRKEQAQAHYRAIS